MRVALARALGFAVALLLLGGGAPAHAGGFAVPEIGARRTGMVAVVGRPDDLSAIYHNPAGLTLTQGTQLYVSFGASFVDTSFRLRPWAGSERFIDAPVDAGGFYPSTKPSRAFGLIPMLAASTNLFTEKVVVATAIYVPNALGSAFPADAVTRYHGIDGYSVAGYYGLSAAYQPVPWLSVGAGVSLVYVTIHGRRLIFPIVNGQDQSALLGANSELTIDGHTVAPGGNFGVLLWPDRRVSLALVAISGATLTVEGPVKARWQDSGVVLTGRQKTGTFIPWTFLAGANADVHRHVEVGMELRYWFYRDYRNQHSDVTGLEPLITALDSPKNYRDSYQLAGGVRVHSLLRGLDTMLGVHYDRTPAPDSTVSFDSPSFTHYGLHLGLRYTLRARYRLSLTYAHYWYLQRDVTDSVTQPPSNFRGSGGNNIVTLSLEALVGRGLGMRAAPQGPPRVGP
jgi:long-subunit fatty acid transport protein